MPNRVAADTARRLSLLASLLVCAGSTATVLLGWSLRIPVLLDYGRAGPVADPAEIVALLLVCIGLTAARRPTPAWLVAVLLLVPALVAAGTLLLHAGAMRSGAPAGGMAAILGLLVMSTALLRLRRVDLLRVASLTAALAGSFAVLALAATLHARDAQTVPSGVAIALPTVIAATVLAVALLIESCGAALDTLASPDTAGWRNLPLVLPAILVTPALIVVLQGLVFPALPDPMQLTSVVPLETLILGAVVWWLINGLVAERMATRALARALDNGPIAMIDSAGTIVHWSRGCEDLYGWSADVAIGQNKYALLKSRKRDGGPMLRPAAGDQHGGVELIEQHRDGRELRVLELARGGDTASTLTVLSLSDITARAAAERALEDSEARLLLATEAHAIGVFEWDTRSNAIHWVGNTELLPGNPRGTISDYDSWAADVFPEDRKAIETRIAAAVWARADRFSFGYRIRGQGGEVRSIEGSARCFYDADGQLDRTIGVNIDVTERVANESQLAAREAQLRSVLETVPDAMIVIDEAGAILTFSPAAEHLFGYAAREAVGRNVAMLMPREHGGRHDDYLRRYLETGTTRVIDRTRILTARRADGRELPIELRVGEARYGGVRVFTGFVRDISERLENEERLASLRSELTHVGRLNAMGELAAGLAHEINQPLTAIANYLAAARRGLGDQADSPLRDHIVAAGEQSLRAGEIIRRMRDFASRHETDTRVEPVEAAIRAASALVLVGYDRLDVGICYDLAPDAAYMLADRIQVQQVLVNLLRNSLDALYTMPKDQRRIRVATRALDPDWIEIRVSDSGPGIAEPILSQLYMPFTSTKGEAGMGIGLSICRRIVEAHGGRLVAENCAGGGAEFRFTVPRIVIETGDGQP